MSSRGGLGAVKAWLSFVKCLPVTAVKGVCRSSSGTSPFMDSPLLGKMLSQLRRWRFSKRRFQAAIRNSITEQVSVEREHLYSQATKRADLAQQLSVDSRPSVGTHPAESGRGAWNGELIPCDSLS